MLIVSELVTVSIARYDDYFGTSYESGFPFLRLWGVLETSEIARPLRES